MQFQEQKFERGVEEGRRRGDSEGGMKEGWDRGGGGRMVGGNAYEN